MLTPIIRFALTQRIFVLMVAGLIIALGAFAWKTLPIDAFPDISPTQVKIILKLPGMTPEEIERQVTQPIETELLGIPDQEMLRSTTKYAITDITLDFKEGTDVYWARQQVSESLSNIWDELPDGIEGGIAPMSTPLSEIFMFSLENPELSLSEKRDLLFWEIRPLLRTIPGVADINILGGYAKTLQIQLDPIKMAQQGVSLETVMAAITDNNLNSGVGKLQIGNDLITVRTEGRLHGIQQLAQLIIKIEAHQTIRLSDVAQIQNSHLTRYGAVTRNGEETAEAIVVALKNSNAAEVIQAVKKQLKQLEATLPPGSQLNVFYDRQKLVDTAVGTLSSALIQSVILVILLLALFLGDLRGALVVSLSLPFAALFCFFLMKQWGMTANLMSLGGLVIAIGMIVDSSVVVVENISRQLSDDSPLPFLHKVFRATKSVAVPVVSGTMIVLIVFSPLLTLSGLEGKLFTPVALTIIFSILSGLVFSLTLIPTISSLLMKSGQSKTPQWMQALETHYQHSLSTVLKGPKALIVVMLALLLVSLFLLNSIGKTFLPTLDEGDIIVQLEKSPTISLEASIALDQQVEKALLAKIPEIKQIVARTGSDELGLDPMSLNETDVFMELAPKESWRFSDKNGLKAAIRDVLTAFPGISYGFTQPIQMRVSEMLTGSNGDVSIKLSGNNIPQLSKLAHEIESLTRSTTGSIDVQTAVIEGGQFLNLRIKPEIASAHNMTTQDLSQYLKTQLEGLIIANMIDGKRRIPIVFSNLQANGLSIKSKNELMQKTLLLPNGNLARLSDIAHDIYAEGPNLIEREKATRFAVVTTNVSGRDVVSFVEALQSRISQEINLPTGYSISYGGEFENQQRATRNLLMVIPGALLLILVILFTTFKSISKASLILINIPFAIMGGIFALYITASYLSVPASVGLIALLGIAVLNGVVMVSYFEESKLLVTEPFQRILQGSRRRLRPVLMTATTAMFGLLPLVYATGPGAEIQKPLAIVVIGGLITSTVATLYLLPLLYLYLEKNHG